MAGSAPQPFRGFSGPNYTPVPDELFDGLMVDLSGAELKVLLYIIRRTFGFKRDADMISLSQMLNGIRTPDGRVLDRGVGLSKKTLLLALRTLEDRRVILTERRQSIEKGNEPTVYQLNVIGQERPDQPSGPSGPPAREETIPPLGEKVRQGGLEEESHLPLGEFLPLPPGGKTPPSPWCKNSPTQETVLRETVRRQTAGSSDFDRVETTRQDREAYGFSKATPSDTPPRQPEIAFSAPAASTGALTSAGPGPADRAAESGPRRQSREISGRAAGGTSPAWPETAVASPDDLRPQIDDRRPATASYGALSGIPAAASRQTERREPPPRLPPYLADLVTRYSEELHDPDHVPQNLGQAGRLWEQSGWSEDSFGQALTEAKTITLKSNVKKRARIGGELGARNKMPFYFTVLRDILGVKKAGQAHADA
jgi:hypothetical protein